MDIYPPSKQAASFEFATGLWLSHWSSDASRNQAELVKPDRLELADGTVVTTTESVPPFAVVCRGHDQKVVLAEIPGGVDFGGLFGNDDVVGDEFIEVDLAYVLGFAGFQPLDATKAIGRWLGQGGTTMLWWRSAPRWECLDQSPTSAPDSCPPSSDFMMIGCCHCA